MAVFGVVIGAVYLLRALRDAFFGPRNPRWDGLHDCSGLRKAPFVFMLAVLLFFGFYPKPIVDVIRGDSEHGLLRTIETVRATREFDAGYPDRIRKP